MSQPAPPAGPDPPSFRERLKRLLARLPIKQAAGGAGLVTLSAASALVVYNITGNPYLLYAAGVSSNIFAGVLQTALQDLLNEPSADEVEQVNRLTERLSLEAQKQPELLKEMAEFLHKVSALEVAEELARENPAQSWLLLSIYRTLLQYGNEFGEVKRILEKILAALGQFTPPALHQLPAPPADFTGRAAQLEVLRAAIGERGVTISGVHGMGGVGKTALALKLADGLKAAYPAHIYLDLQGVGPQPLAPGEIMAHVIRSYRPTAQLPDDPAALAALYRSLLAEQPALLLYDNARDGAQVAPLLPPPGCLLLVTSRTHFTLPGLFALDLDVMAAGEAQALLARIAPRLESADGAAEKLARLCGYLPLALRLAGSALAERKDLAISTYIKRLADAQARLSLVEASLSLSYDLLDGKLQQRWAQLAVFPADFDLAGAAAVWGLDENEADGALGALLRYSLLEWQAGRYRLHDLARLFAASRLAPADEAATCLRHAAHYFIVTWDIDGHY